MSSILKVDTIQDQSGNNIINENADTITIGASGDTITIPAGATLVNNGTASGFGLTWQSVQTTGFTAVKGNAYPCNTTSAEFTVTLPATPSAGDQVQLVDYAGTFDTNALIINGNGENIEGATLNLGLDGERTGVILTYIDSTQGWIATSGINEGTDALERQPYLVDFLVIAGGGSGGASSGGGGGAGGYRNSYSTEPSGGGGSSEASLTFNPGTVYTITVGAGGASVNSNLAGNDGFNSELSGTGISTITSTAGGFGAGGALPNTGGNGGSGGGGCSGGSAGLGTANQGFNGETQTDGGGGGGAGEAGGTDATYEGGDGLASSITGTSVTRAGGGGSRGSGGSPSGGAGGGGAGSGDSPGVAVSGTVNTGSGGGGTRINQPSGAGGKGVVILRMPDGSYSGTTTGSPTVTTGVGGTDTVLIFNDSGSYTG